MKKILYVVIISLAFMSSLSMKAQSYNQEKTALTNFLVRLYENAPFDGVKAVEDYDNSYLMSVVKLDKKKYNSDSVLNRVASVKAMSQASRYLNGANISSEMIIHTSEKSNGCFDTEIIENIRENSSGYVNMLEQLTNFQADDGEWVFIFLSPLSIK
ncbi:MAG: hypothetical protein K2N05_01775 [Muribaculaceae bacterium]|nr:hypothetical protein [Muribaculaceae bacterium]